MKKVLYIMPAFVVCMFIGTIGLLFGFGGFEPIAWGYLIFSVFGSVLLSMNKWWGGLVGAVMGGLVIWERLEYAAYMVLDTMPIGIVFLVYYLLMGLISYKENRKTPNS